MSRYCWYGNIAAFSYFSWQAANSYTIAPFSFPDEPASIRDPFLCSIKMPVLVLRWWFDGFDTALCHNRTHKLASRPASRLVSQLCHQVTPFIPAHPLLCYHRLYHTAVIICHPFFPLWGCVPLLSPSFFYSVLTLRQGNGFLSACGFPLVMLY